MTYSLELQLKFMDPQRFEEMCFQLIKLDFQGAVHVRGEGGDGGLDIVDGDLATDADRATRPLRVWQVKHFSHGVGTSQRKNAEKSLQRAIYQHSPQHWCLCVPVNLRDQELVWWDNLKQRHPGILMNKWEVGEIVSCLLRPMAEGIRNSYLLPLRQVAPETVDAILRILQDFESVSEVLARNRRVLGEEPKSPDAFYKGTMPDWRDILQGFDAPRSQLAGLGRFVLERCKRRGGQIPFLLIRGLSGDGKSTLLRRLAMELVSQDWMHVLWHKQDKGLSADQLCQIDDDVPIVVLIDNVTRFEPDELAGFFERLRDRAARVVVVGAAVRSLWETFQARVQHCTDLRIVDLERMEDEDIEALLDTLDAHSTRTADYLGQLRRHSRERQMALFRDRADRQLLVALLEVTRAEPFENFVLAELDELERRHGTNVKLAAILVSALHEFDLPMPRALLTRLMPTVTDFDLEIVERADGLLQASPTNDDSLVTRHPLVAGIICKRYATQMGTRRQAIIQLALPADEKLIGRLLHALILRDGMPDDGLFSIAMAQFPQDPAFPHMLAMAAADRGDVECAREFFRQASRLDPLDAATWQAWGVLEDKHGHNIGNREQPEEYSARWLFRRAIEADPSQPHAWVAWAHVEARHGNVGSLDQEGSARWLFLQGSRHAPDHPPLWRAWAMVEAEPEQDNLGETVDDPYTARWLYRRLTEVNPRDSSVWFFWAKLEARKENLGEPNDAEPYTARWLFARAVEADPQRSDTWANWAQAEWDVDNPGEAERLYKKALEVEPVAVKQARVWSDLACLHWSYEKDAACTRAMEQARGLFARAVEADPQRSDTWANWAQAEWDVDNPGEAERLYKKALEAEPIARKQARVWSYLARFYRKCGRDEACTRAMEQAVELDQGNAVTMANLGRRYIWLGWMEEAVPLLERAIELAPDNPKVEKWRDDLRYASAAATDDA